MFLAHGSEPEPVSTAGEMVTTRANSRKIPNPIKTTHPLPTGRLWRPDPPVRTRASSSKTPNPVRTTHRLPTGRPRRHRLTDPHRLTEPPFKFEKGSTTLGFIYNYEGIVIAVDHSRLSLLELPQNVLFLNSHLLAAFSGGSESSCKYLLHDLPNKCSELAVKEGRNASAAEIIGWLADYLSRYPDSDEDLSLGILVAGRDVESGPSLYKVNGKGNFFNDWTVGTGSGSAGRVIFKVRTRRYHYRMFEAVEEAKQALCLAAYRAPERLYCIGSEGIAVEVFNVDIKKWRKRKFSEVGMEWVDPKSRQ